MTLPSAFGAGDPPPPFGRRFPHGDVLRRFFGTSPHSSPPGVQRVAIGRLLSESSRALVGPAEDLRGSLPGSADGITGEPSPTPAAHARSQAAAAATVGAEA
jgi:hypothetical protein